MQPPLGLAFFAKVPKVLLVDRVGGLGFDNVPDWLGHLGKICHAEL